MAARAAQASRRRDLALLCSWLAVGLPPLAAWFEMRMLGHMLVQIPLLVLCGWLAGRRLLQRWPQAAPWARRCRWALLLCATFTLAAWMIPRLLDLAVESRTADAAKMLSLPLLAGLPLAWAWSSFGPVMHGLVHVEALATLWRLGWLYLESPTRLCSRYAMEDQHRLGAALLALGSLYALWLGARALGLRSVWASIRQ